MKPREVKLRPSVAEFAQAMERQLRRHDKAKGRSGWRTCTRSRLLQLLTDEYAELVGAFCDVDRVQVDYEAIDLANMCMMLRDVRD